MEFLQNLFPQAPSYLSGLLGEEQALAAQRQAQQQGLLGLGLGLLQAAAPAPVRPSLGAGLAQGLAAGQQAYQNVFQQRVQEADIARKIQEQRRQQEAQNLIRQLAPVAASGGELDQRAMSALAGLLPPDQYAKFIGALETQQKMLRGEAPEYKEIGGKLVQINKRTGKTEVVYEAGQVPKLSDIGTLYAAVNFPGVPIEQLKPDQLADILKFQQTPSPKDLADLQIKAETLRAETNIDLTGLIRGLAGPMSPSVIRAAPVQAPGVSPAVSPVAAPTAPPVAGAPVTPAAEPPQPTMIPAVENPEIPLKFQTELKLAQPKVISATRGAIRDLRDLRDSVEKLRNHPGLSTATGMGGQVLSAIPGTQAANALALLENLKNRNFIAGIVNLRQQSPTGSGVGSLTEREGARFENLKAALSQAQTVDQFREQLDILSRATNESIQALYEGYRLDYPRNRTIEDDVAKSIISPQATPQKSLQQIFGGK